MASQEETDQKWCARTFKWLDSEMGLIQRWRLEGRDSRVDRWQGYGQIERPPSEAELYDALRREISGGGRRLNRVTAWPKGAKHQVSTHTWSDDTFSEEDLEEEDVPGTPTGFIAQVVAHNEFLFRYATRTQSETIEYLARSIQDQREDNEQLRKEKLEWFHALQDLLDRKGEREIKLMREGSVTKGVDAIVDLARYKLAPGIIAPGERGAALEDAIESLGQSFTPEQLDKIHETGILRPEQEAALLQLLVKAKEIEDAAAEERKALPEKPKNGHRVIPLTPQALRGLKELLPDEKYRFVVDVLQALADESIERLGTSKQEENKPDATGTDDGSAE